MRFIVIDNYDSFTYNLVQLLNECGVESIVKRNDLFELDEISNYDKILLSPGPGIPNDAGLTKKVIERFGAEKSILGVCLGHQAIAEVYGAELINLDEVYHGVATEINLNDSKEKLFKGLPKQIEVGRYHSWCVHENLSDELVATAFDKNAQVMALRHKEFDVRGIQFHPESILTPQGKQIIENWIKN